MTEETVVKNLIVVCGPTASGKTRLGVRIAERYHGEIVSCDSRQVYRGMDIGTGKDTAEYRTGTGTIPCHLIDIADPADMYTVHRYQKDFYRTFHDISSRSFLPVVVGGSGLYLEAVLRGFAIPNVPENPVLRQSLMRREKSSLQEELLRLDPALYLSTDLSSKKRIVRSLEIASSSDSVPQSRPSTTALAPVVLGVVWERRRLAERIAARLRERFEQGMVEEVERLLASGIPRARFALFGMEYKHIARFLGGEIEYAPMVEALERDIRRLAKRQETWFRGMERRGVEIHWVKEANIEEAMEILGLYQFH